MEPQRTTGPSREEAIVLRTLKLGDSSKIVTVLTPTYGRVKVVAKGSRKLGSRMGSLLEPGNELELVVYARPGRDLWMLSDASLRRSALRGGGLTELGRLDKLAYLLAAMELADRLLPEQQSLPELEELYRWFLDRWHAEAGADMPALFFGLELELLDRLGVGLAGRHCAECGRPLDARALYRVADGTFSCESCGRGAGRWVTETVMTRLNGLSLRAEPGAPIEGEEKRALGRLLHEHMGFHLPNYRLPRSLYWLRGSGATSSEQDK